jgi:hypothetical protein
VQQLARHANTVDAQTIARLTDERRWATLLAFITTLEATATDDVLDLFDIVMTRMVNEAQKQRQQTRLRGVRDLSPTIRLHINMFGRPSFTLPDAVARGELRPLRDPRQTVEEAA